jgi:hypothetical protein
VVRSMGVVCSMGMVRSMPRMRAMARARLTGARKCGDCQGCNACRRQEHPPTARDPAHEQPPAPRARNCSQQHRSTFLPRGFPRAGIDVRDSMSLVPRQQSPKIRTIGRWLRRIYKAFPQPPSLGRWFRSVYQASVSR